MEKIWKSERSMMYMDKLVAFMNEKVEPFATKVSGSAFIKTISSAFTMIMGVIIGGAFFALLGSLNIGHIRTLLLR